MKKTDAEREYSRLSRMITWAGTHAPQKSDIRGSRAGDWWIYTDGSALHYTTPYSRSLVPNEGVIAGLCCYTAAEYLSGAPAADRY